jgi:PDZ domain-containing protein
LQHGDVVLRVNGDEVTGPEQLARVVQDAGPGAALRLDLRRDDADQSVEVSTVASPADPAKGYLGVSLGVLADSPVTVDFHLDDVGGPSAGLIFSLGIVDKLTSQDLLDGRFVAGTGTMDDDGTVGAIGGIAQKLAAAKENGAQLFLAPKDNCDEIPSVTPQGLTVAAVETLDQAVRVLEGTLEPPSCPVA